MERTPHNRNTAVPKCLHKFSATVKLLYPEKIILCAGSKNIEPSSIIAKLSSEDVLELLWDCKGRITHLELFNFKDWQNGDMEPIQQINELQHAINDGSVPRLKHIILTMLRDIAPELHDSHEPAVNDSPRVRKMRVILQNLPVFCSFYRTSKLRTSLGTDSTSRPGSRFGMGLAYPETLPRRARRELDDTGRSAHLLLPIRTELKEQITYTSGLSDDEASPFIRFLRRLPCLRHLGQKKKREWKAFSRNSVVCNEGRCSIATSKDSASGNIITLGGNDKIFSNGFRPTVGEERAVGDRIHYLNSRITNAMRFFIGFMPAFFSFFFTQAGMLAWLGAPLWFLISAVRNIVQSVLGNGGWHRSSLLHWKSYMTWTNFYTSLMYNGLAVVLLEPILRWKVLQLGMGWNIITAPVGTYMVLGLACGLFKMGTHAIQGFSTRSLCVDALCTLISLPLILIVHSVLQVAVGMLHYDAAALIPFTVFVVKLVSDFAVGVADGIFDRDRNLRLRMTDYRSRLKNALTLYSRLEAMFPEKNVLNMLSHPADLLATLEKRDPQLRLDLVINALDLMYFWFYQPRANYALLHHLRRFSKSEKLVLLRMQEVLRLEKLVSQLLLQGLVGENFSGPLSFYVANCQDYLHQMTAAVLGERTAKVRDR